MPRQIPLHPRHAANSDHPQIREAFPRPRDIDDRKIRLHPHDRDTKRVQHIDPVSRCRHYIPIASQLDAIWNAILRKEEDALVRETGALVHDV